MDILHRSVTIIDLNFFHIKKKKISMFSIYFIHVSFNFESGSKNEGAEARIFLRVIFYKYQPGNLSDFQLCLTGQTVRSQRSSCRRRNLFTLAQFFFFHFLLFLLLLAGSSSAESIHSTSFLFHPPGTLFFTIVRRNLSVETIHKRTIIMD